MISFIINEVISVCKCCWLWLSIFYILFNFYTRVFYNIIFLYFPQLTFPEDIFRRKNHFKISFRTSCEYNILIIYWKLILKRSPLVSVNIGYIFQICFKIISNWITIYSYISERCWLYNLILLILCSENIYLLQFYNSNCLF